MIRSLENRAGGLLSLLALVMACSPPFVLARSPSWNDLHDQAKSLEARKEHAEATRVAENALRVAEDSVGPDDPQLVELLKTLSMLYLTQRGGLARAEATARRALRISEQAFGPNDTRVADAAYFLGEFYRIHDLATAERLYEQALAIRERWPGPQDVNLGIVLDRLMTVKVDLGKYAEAESLCKRALAVWERFGPVNNMTLTDLSWLAILSRLQGRYEEAESRTKHALALTEQDASLGELGNAIRDSLLGNLADVHAAQGRCGEAVPVYAQLLEAAEPELEEARKTSPEFHLDEDAIAFWKRYAGCLRTLGQAEGAQQVEEKIQKFSGAQQPQGEGL